MTDSTTSQYDGTLERTADGGVIRFERHLAFPIRDVWDAITNPARLADWWLPFDADITHREFIGGNDSTDIRLSGLREDSGAGSHHQCRVNERSQMH